MKKWRVVYPLWAAAEMEAMVEAETREEAIEKAVDQSPLGDEIDPHEWVMDKGCREEIIEQAEAEEVGEEE
jgi:hypothetical protein